jgi:hypothetical protein
MCKSGSVRISATVNSRKQDVTESQVHMLWPCGRASCCICPLGFTLRRPWCAQWGSGFTIVAHPRVKYWMHFRPRPVSGSAHFSEKVQLPIPLHVRRNRRCQMIALPSSRVACTQRPVSCEEQNSITRETLPTFSRSSTLRDANKLLAPSANGQ